MLKLPEEYKSKILARLRDPNMKQAKGTLATDEMTMCCLGHITQVVGCGFVGADENLVTRNSGAAGTPDSSDLPDAVFEALDQVVEEGLDEQMPVMAFLARHNDGTDGKDEWSLPQAADWIEENL